MSFFSSSLTSCSTSMPRAWARAARQACTWASRYTGRFSVVPGAKNLPHVPREKSISAGMSWSSGSVWVPIVVTWLRGSRPGGRCVTRAGIELLQSLAGLDDGDALMAAQGQQVLAVARDDQVGTGGDGGGEHLVVVGVGGHHARHLEGLDQFDRCDVVGEHVARRLADEGQPLGRRGPPEHIGQLFEQRRAAADLHLIALADCLEQPIRGAAPQ